jgi:BlaI family penicillinase repressor
MNIPKISDAEWEVMKMAWKKSPISSEDIIFFLTAKMNCSAPTIKTYINRLLKKGALGYEKSGRSYSYYPLLSEKDCISAESSSFLDRVYDGAVGLLFSNFIEDENLSEKDIERLQKLLENKKKHSLPPDKKR